MDGSLYLDGKEEVRFFFENARLTVYFGVGGIVDAFCCPYSPAFSKFFCY